MAYIYKITNQINGKIYIGKTLSTIENRWSQHKYDYYKDRAEQRPLYSAMLKYGLEYFKIQQIEECPAEIAGEREKYWIQYYNSYVGSQNSNGYNATIGGDGCPSADRELVIKLWTEGKNRVQIRDITKYDFDTIKNILTEFNISDEELERRRVDSSRLVGAKKVAKIDLNTNQILHIYNSVSEANRDIGGSKHVTDVCMGKRKTCKGYGWKYID